MTWGARPSGAGMRIDGNETVEYRIEPTRHAPAEARRRVKQHLPLAFPPDGVHDAALAVSELVTFGLREELFSTGPGGAVVLRLDPDARRVQVEIDHGGQAGSRGWHVLEDSLFELVVLNVITSGWGILADGTGVWFTVDSPSSR